MKTSNLLLLISVPILMLSCAEQPTADCQKEQIQIEDLKEQLDRQDNALKALAENVCSLPASPYDHLADVGGRPIDADSLAFDYIFVYSVYVPRSVRLTSVNFNPNKPSVIWEVNVIADSVSLSDEPYDRWVTDTLILPNNMTMVDLDGDGQIVHWDDDYPNSGGELDQRSAFLLVIVGADSVEKSRTNYMLKKAAVRSLL